MNENTLNSFLGELERINNKITNEIENRYIREIQRDELELLYKILQQLKIEESSNDLSWEKNNIFYSISLLHYNIRFYPTLLGLRSPFIMIEKAICEKGPPLAPIFDSHRIWFYLFMKYSESANFTSCADNLSGQIQSIINLDRAMSPIFRIASKTRSYLEKKILRNSV
ncbi:hypothetical protein Lsai_0543 [Legionella sainthelensi]|uniref:Uncharacterized protein n=1 Tax=Legionella sainthelensi TaxID=28087 RepID=A0A0W0YRZ8_9GAMM|nr:hypothetical protein [Legionella sainthelensi]KTD59632.1 hypothetical protein Lsai_0543 [Legionella sainthelensi]